MVTEIGAGKKYAVITYGCQMNEHDSEIFAGQLNSLGYSAADELSQADLVLVNTCCVRESAEQKIYGKIGQLKGLKKIKPELIIIVAGCMAQKEQEKLQKRAPHIDIILGTANITRLAELIIRVINDRQPVLAVGEGNSASPAAVPARRKKGVAAWVPITYGCNNFCTYCIVPYVRGRETSRRLPEILTEIESLAADGFKEITLLGQNVNSYGRDLAAGYDFADLLRAIDELGVISRIRYMTSHPRDMNDKVIEVVRNSQNICEHFHLPVQSGSDWILTRMNRAYSAGDYLKLVEKIRKSIPQASITTDIIVGFPGETAALFAETLQFVKQVAFDAAYTFLYSQRSGTPAAAMPDQVDLAVKKDRLHQLMKVQNDISREINRRLEGKTVEVLVEGPSKSGNNTLTGRTRTNKIVIWDQKTGQEAGQLINIKIIKGQTWVLKGQA